MKTISFINLKGGVGKTTISINVAHILSQIYGARVLYVENDKQGNASLTFNAKQENQATITDVLADINQDITEAIQKTKYKDLDFIAADYALPGAIQEVMFDKANCQYDRYAKALEKVKENYDICILENPPDNNIAVLNALVATDEVIVIITPDEWSVQGMQEMQNYIDEARRYKKNLLFRGCIMNFFVKTSHSFCQKAKVRKDYPIFDTNLRWTKDKLNKNQPILEISPTCGFALDIKRFVKEILK